MPSKNRGEEPELLASFGAWAAPKQIGICDILVTLATLISEVDVCQHVYAAMGMSRFVVSTQHH